MTVAIDVDVTGNGPRTVGTIENCIRIDTSEISQLDIDIVVPDPGIPADAGIKGWQLDLLFDPSVVRVVDHDPQMLLAQAEGSDLLTAISELPPDDDGAFTSAGVEFSQRRQIEPDGSQEVGPGVIARITLSAVGKGTTNLTLDNLALANVNNRPIPLGSILGAAVSVDTDCEPPPSPVPLPGAESPAAPGADMPLPGTPGAEPADATPAPNGGPADGQTPAAGAPVHAQQPETRIGIDADPTGNTETSLGAIDECVVISEGESHAVDIFVEDVTDLLAWEAVLTFEPEVLQVVDEDVSLFMAANEGSDVQDVSGKLPDSDGRYWVQAFDAADPLAPDSGSGVLARVTVKGVGSGVSELRLPLSDVDGDGNPDEGPLLRDVDANSIGDVNSDTLFDGPIAEARIAVDASCTGPPGPATGADDGGGDEGDGIGAVTVMVVVVGLTASVAVGGLTAAWATRHRSSAKG